MDKLMNQMKNEVDTFLTRYYTKILNGEMTNFEKLWKDIALQYHIVIKSILEDKDISENIIKKCYKCLWYNGKRTSIIDYTYKLYDLLIDIFNEKKIQREDYNNGFTKMGN